MVKSYIEVSNETSDIKSVHVQAVDNLHGVHDRPPNKLSYIGVKLNHADLGGVYNLMNKLAYFTLSTN